MFGTDILKCMNPKNPVSPVKTNPRCPLIIGEGSFCSLLQAPCFLLKGVYTWLPQ